MAWQDHLQLYLRSVKGEPLTSTELDLNFTRIGQYLADAASGHNHDGDGSRLLSQEITLDCGTW